MPRSLKGCAGRIYLIMLKGIYWFNGSYLKGFNDGMYGVMTNEEGETIFVRYNNAEL